MDEHLERDLMDAVDAMAGDLVAAVRESVAIRSVPPLPAAVDEADGEADGERQASLYFQHLLEASGLETELVTVQEGRPNVGARLAGRGGGRSLMLAGHVDVVAPGPADRWTHGDPWSAVEVGGRLYGRGTADTKGAGVCAAFACRALREVGVALGGDVRIALAVGEEIMDTAAGIGGLLDAGYRADGAVVMEPTTDRRTGPGVGTASRGQLILRVAVGGRAVHLSHRGGPAEGSEDPEDGVSAIDKALLVQQALAELDERWRSAAAGGWRATTYPLVSDGGTWIRAAVPDGAVLWYLVYYRHDQHPDAVEAEVRQAVAGAARRDWWLRDHPPEVDRVMLWPALVPAPPTGGVAPTLARALARVEEREPPVGPVGFCSDATFVREAGIDTVVFGPGEVRVAHGFDEYVAVDDLVAAAKTYALTAADWCRVS